MVLEKYDIIVVGAGHAGSEAAAAGANMGAKVLLITMDMTKIAQMSCNPAIGGIAKGQIVREIDAMGGYSGIVTDRSMIQFRMLNRSKGPAMWSPRAQCDRMKFSIEWRKVLETNKNVDLWQDTVDKIIVKHNKVVGVITRIGLKFFGTSVILTNGTFLNGLMHIGKKKIIGGRASESSATGLSKQLKSIGFEIGRMKTGTPARIDGRTINFELMDEQKGDEEGGNFSFLSKKGMIKKQRSCYITYTNKKVHDELKKGFKESPMFDGTIKSIGPRYCPSIEDKIVTFADKEKHQLFVEPEGENTVEYYINGFSSSLPWNIQLSGIRKIKGLENVKVFRPGYAIEYDYYPPVQIKHTMETKIIENLYFAGQINGTTGYEEAAAQGLMAAINAALKIQDKEEMVLERDQAYIGVLIDDLVTKGVDEPYRMFTSRAEYRILLRQDNADVRLTEMANKIGLAKKERVRLLKEKMKKQDKVIRFLESYSIKPEQINKKLKKIGTTEIRQSVKLKSLILRPEIKIIQLSEDIKQLEKIIRSIGHKAKEVIEAAEIEIKYAGYIERERKLAEKQKRLEYIKIRKDLDYSKILSLSTEGRQKLEMIRPGTIGQASRITGVSPADINVLLVYLGR